MAGFTIDTGRLLNDSESSNECKSYFYLMKRSNLQEEVDLRRIILQIITDYQAITATDIWYELGENCQFDGGITRSEVTEVVSELEKQNIIVKGKEDKWEINSLGTRHLSLPKV